MKFSLCDGVSALKCVQDFKHLGFLASDLRYSNHMWQTKVYIIAEGKFRRKSLQKDEKVCLPAGKYNSAKCM